MDLNYLRDTIGVAAYCWLCRKSHNVLVDHCINAVHCTSQDASCAARTFVAVHPKQCCLCRGPLLSRDERLSHMRKYGREDPQEQARRDEVHPSGDADGSQQEAQRRINQQDQHYDRRVDPLSLRPRFET